MKDSRICTNPGCLYILGPTKVAYVEGPDKDEENAKLDVIDAHRKCPKCNAQLTKFIHHVWEYVKDNEDILKTFRVIDKASVEAQHKKFMAAKEVTAAQLEKDIIKYKKAV